VFRIIESLETAGRVLVWVPRFIPSFNVIGGMTNILFKGLIANANQVIPAPGALDMDVAGPDVILLAIHFVFWSIILILIECEFCSCFRRQGSSTQNTIENLDSDVLDEQNRIENTYPSDLAVRAHQLKKVFGKKVAVKGTSFGLNFGDCF